MVINGPPDVAVVQKEHNTTLPAALNQAGWLGASALLPTFHDRWCAQNPKTSSLIHVAPHAKLRMERERDI